MLNHYLTFLFQSGSVFSLRSGPLTPIHLLADASVETKDPGEKMEVLEKIYYF